MEKTYRYCFLTILFLSPLLTAYLTDLNRLFYLVGDTDLALLGEGLAFNSNLSQNFFDHPSFPLNLVTGWWYRFLFDIGLSDIWDFKTLSTYESKFLALQHLIVRLRILAVLINVFYLLVLFFLLRKLSNTFCSMLGLLIAATSQGVNSQSVMLRMEPLSLIFTLLGLICIAKILSKKTIRLYAVFVWSSFAFTFIYLAAITKVTALLYCVLLIPLVALSFANHKRTTFVIERKLDYFLVLLACSIGSIYIYNLARYSYKISHSISSVAFFVFFIAVYLGSTQIFFRSLKTAFVQLASIPCGISLAYSLNFIRYSQKNHLTVLEFVDHTRRFAISTQENLTSPVVIGVDRFLVSILSKCDIIWLKNYPIQIFLFFGIFYVLRSHSIKARYVAVGTVMYGLASYMLVETLSRFRNIVPDNRIFDRANFDSVIYYKIYTEIFIVIMFVGAFYIYQKATGFKQKNVLVMLITLPICIISYCSNIYSLEHDEFKYLSFNQTTFNACRHTIPARHMYAFISGSDNSDVLANTRICEENLNGILLKR